MEYNMELLNNKAIQSPEISRQQVKKLTPPSPLPGYSYLYPYLNPPRKNYS